MPQVVLMTFNIPNALRTLVGGDISNTTGYVSLQSYEIRIFLIENFPFQKVPVDPAQLHLYCIREVCRVQFTHLILSSYIVSHCAKIILTEYPMVI